MQVRVELPTNEAPSPDGDHIIGRSPAMCEVFKADRPRRPAECHDVDRRRKRHR